MGRPVPLIALARHSATIGRRCHSTTASAQTGDSSARLRFAPSPTGYLHLGGLRTALFNHLLARKWKGKWILRIEDTDRTRLVPGAVDNLRRSLDWVGLDYDEGVGVGGSKGPYTQSERLDIYNEHSRQLLSEGKAYHCFCTPDESQAIKMTLKRNGEKRNYDGRCAHLTEEDVARRKKAGHKYVVRFKTTPDRTLPPDLIFGDVQTSGFGADDDFIMVKSDGWPTYHFASVVDDHLMGITHVLRGEEWLPSLTKHHQLYTALGWTPPAYAHLPLLVNPDGSKLSKRTGDVNVEAYRDRGYEPGALLNFLALMGWDHHAARPVPSSITERSDSNSLSELFSMDELIEHFDLSHVNHRKAAVDMAKLDFLNKMTLRRDAGRLGDDGNLRDEVIGHEKSRRKIIVDLQAMLRERKVLRESPLVEDIGYVEKVLDAELARTVRLNEIPQSSVFFFLDPQYDQAESQGMLKPLKLDRYVEVLDAVIPLLRTRLESLAEETGNPNAINEDVIWDVANQVTSDLGLKQRSRIMTPMRHALTGRKMGPSVPTVMVTLGVERSLARLEAGRRYVHGLL